MRENFNASLDATLAFEGGYVNHPDDPGGHTNRGVTLTTLRQFMPGATVADLKAISQDMLRRIYRTGYWNTVSADTLAAGVDLVTFDYAVNSGPSAARKNLLAVVGGTAADTVKRLCARRLSIYRTFRHWKSFGKGWTRRVTAMEAKGVAWALAALPAIEPHEVKEALAEESAKAGKAASKNGAAGGATGAATGGGAAIAPEHVAEQASGAAGWIVFGVIVAVGLVTALILLRRSRINAQRADAYRAEALAVEAA